MTCVLTFYLKDLSLALGQTDRITIILAVWNPILALTLFTFIGVFQINENSFLNTISFNFNHSFICRKCSN